MTPSHLSECPLVSRAPPLAEVASPHLWALSPQQRPPGGRAHPGLGICASWAETGLQDGAACKFRGSFPSSQPKWDGSVETHPSPGAPRGELPAVVVTHSLMLFTAFFPPVSLSHPLTYFLDQPPSKLPAPKPSSQSLLWGDLRLRPPPPRLGPGAVRSPTSVWNQAFSE